MSLSCLEPLYEYFLTFVIFLSPPSNLSMGGGNKMGGGMGGGNKMGGGMGGGMNKGGGMGGGMGGGSR